MHAICLAFVLGWGGRSNENFKDRSGADMDASTLLGWFYVALKLLMYCGIVYLAVREIRRERKP